MATPDWIAPKLWKTYDPNNEDWNLANTYHLTKALRQYKGNVPPEILKQHGITPADAPAPESPLENIPRHVNRRESVIDEATMTPEEYKAKYGKFPGAR